MWGVAEGDYEEWIPPEQFYEVLTHARCTRDKVEMVLAFYAWQHGGPYPTDPDVGKVLGISKQRVAQVKVQLVARGRATKKHGKFSLRLGKYSNPLVSMLLKALGMEGEA